MRSTELVTQTSPIARIALGCASCALVVVIGLGSSTPVAADEPKPSPSTAIAPVPIPAPLRVLKGYDASLARTSELGIYLRRQRVGAFQSALTQAPAESGAVYLEVTTLSLQVGVTRYAQTVKIFMASDLSLVRKETLEITRAGEALPQSRRTILALEKGAWVRTHLQGEGEEGTRSAERTPSSGPNYGPCLTAVAAKLAQSTKDGSAASYQLPAILWAGRKRKKTGPATLTLAIGTPREIEHRGRRVQAVRAQITGKGDPLELWLTPKGQLLTMSGSGIPYTFVQGTPAEIAADLPEPATSAPRGAKTPRDAIEAFLLALARVNPADSLDAVVDFEAVLAGMQKSDPTAPKVSAKDLATLFKTRIERGGGPMTKGLAKAQLKKLKVKIKGHAASAWIPQHKDPFQLRRTPEDRWLIVSWPAK